MNKSSSYRYVACNNGAGGYTQKNAQCTIRLTEPQGKIKKPQGKIKK